jgi:hypothetical protein
LSCVTFVARTTFTINNLAILPGRRPQNFWVLLNSREAPLGAVGIASTICGVLLQRGVFGPCAGRRLDSGAGIRQDVRF